MLEKFSIWIKLSSLPLEWWTIYSLKAIGNMIGKTLAVDDSFLTLPKWFIARVLVEMDMSGGFFELIDLVVGGHKFIQILNYVNVPFRCVKCHMIGHVLAKCSVLTVKNKWVPKVSKGPTNWVEYVLGKDKVTETLSVSELVSKKIVGGDILLLDSQKMNFFVDPSIELTEGGWDRSVFSMATEEVHLEPTKISNTWLEVMFFFS
jgi:hypothetical protein